MSGPRRRGAPTGPRKGSMAHWLSTFEIGEVRFWQSPDNKPGWKMHPPPSRTRHIHKFTCNPFCAVPMGATGDEPIYIWRVERTA